MSSPFFDLRLNTLDVSKTWLHPSSLFLTNNYLPCFLVPAFFNPLHPPRAFPQLLPYPITHIPSMIFPLYPFRVFPIPVECRRYSWDNRGLTRWLASAGNREYAYFLLREAAPPFGESICSVFLLFLRGTRSGLSFSQLQFSFLALKAHIWEVRLAKREIFLSLDK